MRTCLRAGQVRLELPLSAPMRGILRLERLRLATAQPFGLFRAWTWVHTATRDAGVSAAARHGCRCRAQSARSPARARSRGAGADEWAGLRPFRDGDSPRQVDWKAYAREAPLLVKEYAAGASELRLFDFTRLSDLDTERACRSSRAGWSMPRRAASVMASSCRGGGGCRWTAVPSIATAASPRSRCSDSSMESALFAAAAGRT